MLNRGLLAFVATAFLLASTQNPRLHRTLVVALDGVPYNLMQKMKIQGHFQDFYNVGKMIAPFPSLSNYSWSLIWGVPAIEGFQGEFYNYKTKKVEGSSLDETRSPLHSESYDVLNTSLFSHLKAYLKGLDAAEHDLKDIALQVLSSSEPRTLFAYTTAFDSISHTEGEPELSKSLQYLEEWVKWLRQQHQLERGEVLDIIFVSDHGNRLTNSRMIKLKNILKSIPFKNVKAPHLGVLSNVSFWSAPQDRQQLAQRMSQEIWAEIATYKDNQNFIFVLGKKGFLKFHTDQTKFILDEVQGDDPLEITTEGQLPLNQPLTDATVFEASLKTPFPDSLDRVRRGLNEGINNPPMVLVSAADGFEISGSGMDVLMKVTGRAGTHGSLREPDSLGILMSTQKVVPDFVRAHEVSTKLSLNDMQYRYSAATIYYDPSLKKQKLRVSWKALRLPDVAQIQINVAPLDDVKHSYNGSYHKVVVDLTTSQNPWEDFEIDLPLEWKKPHRIQAWFKNTKGKRIAELQTRYEFFRAYPSFLTFEVSQLAGDLKKDLLAAGRYVPYYLLPDGLEKKLLKGYPSVDKYK